MEANKDDEWDRELGELDEFIAKAKLAAENETNESLRKALKEKIIDLEKGRDRYFSIMMKTRKDRENGS